MPFLRTPLALALSLAAIAPCTPQTLDATFGTAGLFTFAADATAEAFHAMARMGDGRLVLVGTSTSTEGSGLRVVRLLADGTYDPAFSSGNAVSMQLGDGNTQGLAVVVLADGRIVAGGSTEENGARHMFAQRLLANGDPDPTFASGGTFLSDVGAGGEHLNCLVLQSDGKVLLGGDVVTDQYTRACIIRLNTNGTLDNGWGEGGVVLHNAFGGTETMVVNGIALDAAGQVLATGMTALGGTSDVFIMHLLPDGGLDPDYGLAGETIISDGAYDEFAQCIVRAPGGDCYLVGSRFGIGGDDLVFYHIAADGTEQSFGGHVSWQLITEGSEYASEMIMDAQGHLVVAVTAYDLDGIAHAKVLRLATSPAVDEGFGTGGWLELPAPENAEAAALLFQPDGKLVVAGLRYPNEGTSEGLVARYGDIPTNIREHAATLAGVWPNPCTGAFTFAAGEERIDRLQLLDGAGRLVLQDASPLAAKAQRTITLPSGIAPGVYALTVWCGDERSVQRLAIR